MVFVEPRPAVAVEGILGSLVETEDSRVLLPGLVEKEVVVTVAEVLDRTWECIS